MPTRAAASAHWVFRCSVGATTVMRRTVPSDCRLAAICSAKVVLPAPGVATAMKSRGAAVRYCSSASACQARNLGTVPQAARSGYATGSDWAAASEGGRGSLAENREGVVVTAFYTVPPGSDDPPTATL